MRINSRRKCSKKKSFTCVLYTQYAPKGGFYSEGTDTRDSPRFFDQVGHQTTNASIGNPHFSLNNE